VSVCGVCACVWNVCLWGSLHGRECVWMLSVKGFVWSMCVVRVFVECVGVCVYVCRVYSRFVCVVDGCVCEGCLCVCSEWHVCVYVCVEHLWRVCVYVGVCAFGRCMDGVWRVCVCLWML